MNLAFFIVSFVKNFVPFVLKFLKQRPAHREHKIDGVAWYHNTAKTS